MLYGAGQPIEVRREGDTTRLRGAFPYNTPAQLGDGRREVFAPRAFRARVEAGANVYLLLGHDPQQPLASTAQGGLTLRDADDALHVEARVEASTTWARDALAALAGGLMHGLSPGFNVPPGGDRVERADGGLLRTVTRADLFELSLCTTPAYSEAQLSARSWVLNYDAAEHDALRRTLNRWRA